MTRGLTRPREVISKKLLSFDSLPSHFRAHASWRWKESSTSNLGSRTEVNVDARCFVVAHDHVKRRPSTLLYKNVSQNSLYAKVASLTGGIQSWELQDKYSNEIVETKFRNNLRAAFYITIRAIISVIWLTLTIQGIGAYNIFKPAK